MCTQTAIILFNDNERKTAEAVVHRMIKRAVELEGTVTGEHGVGLIKRDYLEHEVGGSTVDAMRRVSATHLQNTLNMPPLPSLSRTFSVSEYFALTLDINHS